MNYLNRMISSITFNKRKSISLICIAAVLALVLLITISIKTTSERSVKKIRDSIPTSISIYTPKSGSVSRTDSNQIAMSTIKQAETFPNVKSYNCGINTLGYAEGFHPIVTDQQKICEDRKKEKEGDKYIPSYDIAIEGNTASKYNDSFSESNSGLMIGKLIEESDLNVCVINYKLAQKDGFAIDSVIAVKGITGNVINLRVIGMYYTQYSESTEIYDPYRNSENLIYTDLTSAMEIAGDNAVAYAEFDMKDPEENEAFVQQVIAANGEHSNDFVFDFDDDNYQLLAQSLKLLIVITNIILVGAILLGGIIITLVVLMAMRDRDYEIGVLLAMGERKYKVILQMLGEVLIPILVGAIIGIVANALLLGIINHLLAKAVTIAVVTSFKSILYMLLSAIGLNLIGGILTVYKIICYQPRTILMHIE